MKAGILTLPLHTNYGGILQAFALQQVLEKFGLEVYVLHHTWEKEKTPISVSLKRTIRNIIKLLVKDHNTIIFPERYLKRNSKIFSQNTDKFIFDNIRTLYLDKLTECENYQFDVIIVGSDQIWRPQYFKNMWEQPIENAYLSFINPSQKIKKIAYACSFGCDSWEYDQKETLLCKSALTDFSLVSVRESAGIGMIKEHFDINAKHVLDPTMLITREEYEKLIGAPYLNNHFVFSYILDNNKEVGRIINEISADKKLEIRESRINPVIKRGELKSNIAIPVEDWLRNIRDAKLVITDSFHACVFSIIFNTPFIVIGNVRRGQSRFASLLKMFRLESHLVEKLEDYDPKESYHLSGIVQTRLKTLRSESLTLLNNALNS